MKMYNKIQEGAWHVFLEDWLMRKNNQKSFKDANFDFYCGPKDFKGEHYYTFDHVVHLWVKNKEGVKFDVSLLTASCRGNYPIVLLINRGDWDELETFDKKGNSSSGNYTLYHESVYFEEGDYVATNLNTIGIYKNSWFLACGIEKNHKEHLDIFGSGQAIRPATPEEIKEINMMLYVNNKKWNPDTKKLENV